MWPFFTNLERSFGAVRAPLEGLGVDIRQVLLTTIWLFAIS